MDIVRFLCFFFFQAEDGIRDRNVTGVQTCALPIYTGNETGRRSAVSHIQKSFRFFQAVESFSMDCHICAVLLYLNSHFSKAVNGRSEERRVGKESRTKRPPYLHRKQVA